MTSALDDLKEVTTKLETVRDELRVKLHLAKADAVSEWEKIESDWRDFQMKFQRLEYETESARKEVAANLRTLGQLLQKRYENVRQVISGSDNAD